MNARVRPPARPRVLVADDQPDVIGTVGLPLKPVRYEADGVGSPVDVRTAVQGRQHDVAVSDFDYVRGRPSEFGVAGPADPAASGGSDVAGPAYSRQSCPCTWSERT